MELLVKDTDLDSVGILDIFESLIWTDRFFSYGDFEIYTPVTNDLINLLREEYFLSLKGSDHTMIIESAEIKTDSENGNKFVVKGRSLESILDRRIIWSQTILTGSFQQAIKKLLDENAISPVASERRITRLIYEDSTDPTIVALQIDAQYMGTNLYQAIQHLCESNGVGFRITLTDDGNFLFKLYSGTDRSYDQMTNPYVVFSPKFDNITNSSYFESNVALKTVSLVAGEGEGFDRKTIEVSWTDAAGSDLLRREMFTDAGDISQIVDGTPLTDEEYYSQLAQRGVEDLSVNVFVQAFDGQVDATRIFVYGRDFFMGDIVQIANEYGYEGKVRVIELIHSESASEISIYPTFSAANI